MNQGARVLHPRVGHRLRIDADGRRRRAASAINPWLGYTGLPTDTVADVQLKTSGLDAAAPLGMGLAANVITKSGTNALHGSGTCTSAPGELGRQQRHRRRGLQRRHQPA